jgi:uncharacterized repeat protein (TIGR04138 family)
VPEVDWKLIRAKAGPYPLEAYDFVRNALAHTVRMIHGEGERGAGLAAPLSAGSVDSTTEGVGDAPSDESRHVSGQQLCLGVRDYALRQYGKLAKTVLGRWHIRSTDDFGRIVFAMIDAGLMKKTEEDELADFHDVFEFDEAFGDLVSSR